jgi:hypothetical protein
MDLNSAIQTVLGTSDYNASHWEDIIGPTVAAILIIVGIFLLFLLLVGYIYRSYTIYKIAKRLDHPQAWLSWIPIANFYIVLSLGDMSPLFMIVYVFPILLSSLSMIPEIGVAFTYFQIPFSIANVIISTISYMNISKKRGYSKELGLMSITPTTQLILFGLLAWGNSKDDN